MTTLSGISKTFELTARWYVFGMIWLYGWAKIFGGQFYRHGHLPETLANKPVADLSAFELAWTFFGYSGAYIACIGLAQIIGGLLLLWERTKLLGVAILIPILANIILVDAIYGVEGAIISAIIYFALLLGILFLNRAKVVAAFQALTLRPRTILPKPQPKILQVLTVFGFLVVLFFLETVLIH